MALTVTAIIPAHNRPVALARVLARLSDHPIAEILVVDNGSAVDLAPIVEQAGARLVRSPVNTGVAARNIGAAIAGGDLLLMLDDDSYPQAETVATLRDLFEDSPRLGAVGGKVIDMDSEDIRPIRSGEELGSFDWLSRFGAPGVEKPEGMPAFFAAEGASMVRRAAFQQVDGFFEPYFRELGELDLGTRLLAAGWDVRYLPAAAFSHMRSEEWRMEHGRQLRFRVRNHIWYFWRHYPALQMVPRVAYYLVFDALECSYQRVPVAWFGGVVDAWRQRSEVGGTRQPVAPYLVDRIELQRNRAHAALVLYRVIPRTWIRR